MFVIPQDQISLFQLISFSYFCLSLYFFFFFFSLSYSFIFFSLSLSFTIFFALSTKYSRRKITNRIVTNGILVHKKKKNCSKTVTFLYISFYIFFFYFLFLFPWLCYFLDHFILELSLHFLYFSSFSDNSFFLSFFFLLLGLLKFVSYKFSNFF